MNLCTNTIGWKLAQEKTREYHIEQKNVRIEQYNIMPSKCKFCDTSLSYDKRNSKFCNNSCAASFNNKGKNRHGTTIEFGNCLHCDKLLLDYRSKFCNNVCSGLYIRNNCINNWRIAPESYKKLPRNIRQYLIEQNDNKCSICNWGEKNPHSNTYPLVVDHIDGNSENNHPNNLRVICPNCDSLTSTYKGLNKGNGRAYRRERYKQGKSY